MRRHLYLLPATLAAVALFAALGAQTASSRVDQLQNNAVKVWRTTVLPHQPLALHHHDHPRVIVALTDGTMDLVDANGTHDVHVWKRHQAYWLPAMPKGALHADVNIGSAPLEVMVVELEKER